MLKMQGPEMNKRTMLHAEQKIQHQRPAKKPYQN